MHGLDIQFIPKVLKKNFEVGGGHAWWVTSPNV